MCLILEESCTFGHEKFDPCVMNWRECLVDPTWTFCSSFPEFCMFANMPTKAFKDGDALGEAICATDKELFCRGSDTDPVAEDVCANFDKLPDAAKMPSVISVCIADPAEICKDTRAGPIACPKGTLSYDLCALSPEKCEKDTESYNECFKNWPDCVTRYDWNFCIEFPDLCPRATN
mmetsp:Transcript_19710/g.24318  ORF Transcript_19710/g.24318 Transcript_19710/m.24318 type:complete len:177 (-) Transcript_19710:349-879(-)